MYLSPRHFYGVNLYFGIKDYHTGHIASVMYKSTNMTLASANCRSGPACLSSQRPTGATLITTQNQAFQRTSHMELRSEGSRPIVGGVKLDRIQQRP